MARNEEKAQSMLNRYWQQKRDSGKPKYTRRPKISDCSSVKECEHWRKELLKEIGKMVNDIQNGEKNIKKIVDFQKNKPQQQKRILESTE